MKIFHYYTYLISVNCNIILLKASRGKEHLSLQSQKRIIRLPRFYPFFFKYRNAWSCNIFHLRESRCNYIFFSNLYISENILIFIA